MHTVMWMCIHNHIRHVQKPSLRNRSPFLYMVVKYTLFFKLLKWVCTKLHTEQKFIDEKSKKDRIYILGEYQKFTTSSIIHLYIHSLLKHNLAKVCNLDVQKVF
ncbi:UNVERIFIED_CONTAM: hypothetical protein K2H54_033137 [Gekko kuhli]